jgi:hypothetical protein
MPPRRQPDANPTVARFIPKATGTAVVAADGGIADPRTRRLYLEANRREEHRRKAMSKRWTYFLRLCELVVIVYLISLIFRRP